MVSSESRMDRAASMLYASRLMLAAGYRFNDLAFLAVHAFGSGKSHTLTLQVVAAPRPCTLTKFLRFLYIFGLTKRILYEIVTPI